MVIARLNDKRNLHHEAIANYIQLVAVAQPEDKHDLGKRQPSPATAGVESYILQPTQDAAKSVGRPGAYDDKFAAADPKKVLGERGYANSYEEDIREASKDRLAILGTKFVPSQQ